MSSLAEAVRRVATGLGDAHVAALAAAYRKAPGCSPTALSAARAAVPAVHHDHVDRVHKAWSGEPAVPGAAIALALEAARLTAVKSSGPKVEVVVTGPDSPAVPIRLTSEVVVGLIAAAQKRVTVISYSVAAIPSVVAALSAARDRGVKVYLVFESADRFAHGSGASAYASHPLYEWPAEERPTPNALLHAKAVIVDGRTLLVTSANLSNLAHQHSLELGLLCHGGGVADKVQRHIDALISQGQLRLRRASE